MRIGGLILAAGEGRRFGGTKQIAELRGRPLLAYAVEAMPPCPPSAASWSCSATTPPRSAQRVDFHGTETVVCDGWHEGQAASLRVRDRGARRRHRGAWSRSATSRSSPPR